MPWEDLPGVVGGIQFLERVARKEPVSVGQRVAIIGGGNTAMDACRTAVRLEPRKSITFIGEAGRKCRRIRLK